MTLQLEEIQAATERRVAAKKVEFETLADRYFAGEPMSGDDVAEVLERVGRTGRDLIEAVALRRERVRLKKQAAELPSLQAQRSELEDHKTDADNRLAAAHEAHAVTMREYLEQVSPLDSKIANAEQAVASLQTERFANPHLVEERRVLEADRREVTRELEAFKSKFMSEDSIRAAEASERARLELELHAAKRQRQDTNEIQTRIAALPAQSQRRRDHETRLLAERDSLSNAIRDIERRMIEE